MPDVTKLPKWAQDQIAHLTRRVEYLEREVDRKYVSYESSVFIDPYGLRIPVGDTAVKFVVPGSEDRQAATVALKATRSGHRLEVLVIGNVSDQLSVHPRSSNLIEIGWVNA